MLRRTEKYEGKITSILGEGSEFKGTLTYNGTIRIDGNFEGEIISNGTVIIGEKAKIKADILTRICIIGGSYEGDITAKERIELLPSAVVKGNLKSPSLSIADGVVLEGQCIIDRSLLDQKKIDITEKVKSSEK